MSVIPNTDAYSEISIASGAITPTEQFHTVAAETGTTDTLKTITTTNGKNGSLGFYLMAKAGHTIDIEDGTGNIKTLINRSGRIVTLTGDEVVQAIVKPDGSVLVKKIFGDQIIPASAATGTVSLKIGSQPNSASGNLTGFDVVTGSENRLEVITQGNLSASFVNGEFSAATFSSFNDISLPDDGNVHNAASVLKVDFSGELTEGYQGDRSGMLMINAQNITNTGALIRYRLTAGTNGQIVDMAEANEGSDTVKVSAVNEGGTITDTTVYVDGKLHVLVDRQADAMYFLNRRGAAATISFVWFHGGGGLNGSAWFDEYGA